MDFDFNEFLKSLGSHIPSVKRCDTTRELADWFTQFSKACRAALPEPS